MRVIWQESVQSDIETAFLDGLVRFGEKVAKRFLCVLRLMTADWLHFLIWVKLNTFCLVYPKSIAAWWYTSITNWFIGYPKRRIRFMW